MTLADGSVVEVESNDAVVVHAADVDGVYVGLVDPINAIQVCSGAPPDETGWRWDGVKWVRHVQLADAKLRALNEIDVVAGAARLRYITDVPGQAGTYLLKAEQAAAFIAAGGVGDVPPYVQAEVDATGMAPLAAAEYIHGLSELWAQQLGPAIERERRIGKLAVEAATTLEEVSAALETTRAVLTAI